jgi:hypothetical protein
MLLLGLMLLTMVMMMIMMIVIVIMMIKLIMMTMSRIKCKGLANPLNAIVMNRVKI